MKLQLCKFKRTQSANYELGLAVISEGYGFNEYNVSRIIPVESNRKVIAVWNYTLINDALKHIDTEY